MTKKLARILVVDDEPNLLEALVECLERAGYRAQPAASGAEALALVREQDFDAALIDINLPDISGPEVLRRMATGQRCPPTCFLTADANEAERQEAQQVSGRAALQKPLSPKVIAQTIRELLDVG